MTHFARCLVPGLALLAATAGCCRHVNYVAGRCDCNPPPVEYLLHPPQKPMPMGGLLTPPAKPAGHGHGVNAATPGAVQANATPAPSSLPTVTPAPNSIPTNLTPATPAQPTVNGATQNTIPIPALPRNANIPSRVPTVETAAPPMPKANQPD